MTQEDFNRWIDDNGGYSLLNEYGYWLAKQIQVQLNLSPQDDNKDESKKKLKKNQK